MSDPEILEVGRVPVALVHEHVPVAELTSFYDRAFTTVVRELTRQEIGRVGPALAVYRGEVTDTADVGVGFPVERPVTDAGPVTAHTLPSGTVVRAIHIGGYDSLPETYALLRSFAAGEGLELADVMWESYRTQPTPEVDPAQLLTEVTWLLQG